MAISTDHGVACVMRFLEEAGVPFEVVEHKPTFTAVDDARTARAELAFTAKTLALHDRHGWRIAVLPASHRLDLEKARQDLERAKSSGENDDEAQEAVRRAEARIRAAERAS